MKTYFCKMDSCEKIRPHSALPGRNRQRKHAINASGHAAELHPLILAAGPIKLIAEYGKWKPAGGTYPGHSRTGKFLYPNRSLQSRAINTRGAARKGYRSPATILGNDEQRPS